MSPNPASVPFGSIVAIDVHVHIEMDEHGNNSLPDDLAEAAAKYFNTGGLQPRINAIAEYYRARNMAAVVFTVDATTNLRHEPISSAEIAAGAADNSDVLVPFGSVDPNLPNAKDRVERLIEESGVCGFKFHPTLQNFDPSDARYYPLYETMEKAGVVALFHTGQTGIGAGMKGGRGLRLAVSNPMLLDEVATEFGNLQIIMAHPSVPWQDEAISVATHKHNTWIDLSGWSPKYFPPQLVRNAGTLLKERVMFGSDFPMLSPDRWLRDIYQTNLKPEALPGILKDNAVRLLGLNS